MSNWSVLLIFSKNMTTNLHLTRYVSRNIAGEYWHGAKQVERSCKEASARRADAAKGQGLRREIALAVNVARQTVYTWKALLDEGGIDALRAVPGRGRPAKLDESQLAGVRAAILRSPTEHGFGTELWTLKRVGAVIERLHGVRFSQAHVWRILGSLGFSAQKPEKRAIERNEDAVRSWKRSTWPTLKKKPSETAD